MSTESRENRVREIVEEILEKVKDAALREIAAEVLSQPRAQRPPSPILTPRWSIAKCYLFQQLPPADILLKSVFVWSV